MKRGTCCYKALKHGETEMIKLIRATLIFICLIIMAEITQMYFNTNANIPFLFGWFACLIINWERITNKEQ